MVVVISGHWFINSEDIITLPIQHFARSPVAHPYWIAPIGFEMKPVLKNFQSDKNCWDANVYSRFSVATMMTENNVIRSMFVSITNFDMSNVSSTVSCCLPPPLEPIISDPVKPDPFDPVGYSVEEYSFPTILPTIPISHEILNKSITKFYLGMIDRQNKDKFFFAKLFFEEHISHDISSLESLQPHESLHDRAK